MKYEKQLVSPVFFKLKGYLNLKTDKHYKK